MVSKGAPQVILALVLNKDDISAKVDESVRRLASKGFRSLGVARTNLQGIWEFVGIVSLYDPPGEDSKETIKIAKTMGVNIKMITGDHIDIAKEIARELNLGTDIRGASQIIDRTDEGDPKYCRTGRRFCTGFSQTQVQDSRITTGKRTHSWHDWRRSKRCTCPKEGRCWNCSLWSNRRCQISSPYSSDSTWTLSYHRCNHGKSQDISANE